MNQSVSLSEHHARRRRRSRLDQQRGFLPRKPPNRLHSDLNVESSQSFSPRVNRFPSCNFEEYRQRCDELRSVHHDEDASVDWNDEVGSVDSRAEMGFDSTTISYQCDEWPEEEAIRRGITRVSTFVASYLAGALSLIFGIFLVLLSPIVKLIKTIFGDLTGLIEDAFGGAFRDAGLLNDWEGLRRMHRGPRRSRRRNSNAISFDGFMHSRIDDYESWEDGRSAFSTAGDSTVSASETAGSQFVGGWTPSLVPSLGSASGSRGSEGTQPCPPRQVQVGKNGPSSRGPRVKGEPLHLTTMPHIGGIGVVNGSSSCPPSVPLSSVKCHSQPVVAGPSRFQHRRYPGSSPGRRKSTDGVFSVSSSPCLTRR